MGGITTLKRRCAAVRCIPFAAPFSTRNCKRVVDPQISIELKTGGDLVILCNVCEAGTGLFLLIVEMTPRCNALQQHSMAMLGRLVGKYIIFESGILSKNAEWVPHNRKPGSRSSERGRGPLADRGSSLLA